MKRKDLNLSGIVNNDYKSVAFGRKSHHQLDPDYKVSRDEISDIIAQAAMAAPNAVGSQPWRFLICDTDESKAKLNDIMRIYDKDRVNKCSFAVAPFADRNWFDSYDELLKTQSVEVPDRYDPEMCGLFKKVVYDWYIELSEGNGEALDRSVCFQTGLVTMAFVNACRAHGLDSGVMDSWDPQLLGDAFGIDLDRYIPMVAIAVGKAVADEVETYRYPPEDMIEWGE